MTPRLALAARLVTLALLAVGCRTSPTMITSLEDLTSETQGQGRSDLPQNRILSITGLLPHAQVGSLYHYKKSRSPSTAIGISNGCSYYVTTTYGHDCGDPAGGHDETTCADQERAALTELRDEILNVRLKASKALSLKVAAAKAQAQLVKARASEKDDGETSGLESRLDTAQDDYQQARDAFDLAINEAAKKITRSGVMVVRWDAKKSTNGGATLGTLFGFNRSEDSTASGFAIFSSLRLTNLFVGSDVHDIKPDVRRTWQWKLHWRPWFIGENVLRNIRLTTYLLQARNVLYLQDMEVSEETELALEGSYQELSDLGNTLEELDKVEVEYIRSRIESLSNMGLIAETTRHVYPAHFPERGGQPCETCQAKQVEFLREVSLQVAGRKEAYVLEGGRFGATTAAPTDGWQTVYAVDTDYDTLLKRVRPASRSVCEACAKQGG